VPSEGMDICEFKGVLGLRRLLYCEALNDLIEKDGYSVDYLVRRRLRI
jgi:hypothetical protein